MNNTRETLKRKLIDEAGGNPICPITGQKATDLHEVIAWAFNSAGDKYGKRIKNDARWYFFAQYYYVPELCILLSNKANVNVANSRRDDLLRIQFDKYGVERVVKALRKLGNLIKNPSAYIPVSIEYDGEIITILENV